MSLYLSYFSTFLLLLLCLILLPVQSFLFYLLPFHKPTKAKRNLQQQEKKTKQNKLHFPPLRSIPARSNILAKNIFWFRAKKHGRLRAHSPRCHSLGFFLLVYHLLSFLLLLQSPIGFLQPPPPNPPPLLPAFFPDPEHLCVVTDSLFISLFSLFWVLFAQ